MPLQDASRNQSNRNKDSGNGAPPSKSDVSFLMERAEQNAPYVFELSWKKPDSDSKFILSVNYKNGVDGEPTWWLTSGTEDANPVVWIMETENPDEVYKLVLKSLTAVQEAPVNPASEGRVSPSQDMDLYQTLDTNEVIAGRYRILSQIGHGGMGRVYQAVDVPNNRVIALKVLHPHLLDDEDSVKRFEREAKAAIHLRHPNLLTVYDFGFSEQGLPYIAMEYLNGEVLKQLLDIDGPLELKRFLTIFLQICHALHHAHINRVIHRDVKPGNIMLIKIDQNSDLAKIVDFGIAKIVRPDGKTAQKLTQTGDVFGSPFYMSPEQCMGLDLDPRSDIYSLGCVMYEAISGKRPLEGPNALITMQMHVSNQARSFTEVCPQLEVPPQIESLIFRALEKKPEDRFQTVKELGVELERLLKVDQISMDKEWITKQTRSGTFYTQQSSKGVKERSDLTKVLDLLKECELINGNEHRQAMQLLSSSSADASKYLVSKANLSEKTLHAAVQCQRILERGECKLEMAVIALHYCHRNGVSLKEAFDQLGWRLSPGTDAR